MNRRTLLSFLGIAPGATAAGLVITSNGVLHIGQPSPSQASLARVRELIRECNLSGGDVGRTFHSPDISECVSLIPALRSLGFEPYLVPGLIGTHARFLPIYGPSGGPSALVWHGFVRQARTGVAEIVSFEHSHLDVKNYHALTGLTLAEALDHA